VSVIDESGLCPELRILAEELTRSDRYVTTPEIALRFIQTASIAVQQVHGKLGPRALAERLRQFHQTVEIWYDEMDKIENSPVQRNSVVVEDPPK